MTTSSLEASNTALLLDPAPHVDPLETIEYESWMFFQTADLALNHWNEFQNIVIRNAIVEDAVLHARSLCDVILSESERKDDIITLPLLIPGYDETIEKYRTLRDARGQLSKEYKGKGRRPTYEKLFNSRVMHPTVLRGDYGLYEKPLCNLHPKILAVVREIATLTGHHFRLIGDGRQT